MGQLAKVAVKLAVFLVLQDLLALQANREDLESLEHRACLEIQENHLANRVNQSRLRHVSLAHRDLPVRLDLLDHLVTQGRPGNQEHQEMMLLLVSQDLKDLLGHLANLEPLDLLETQDHLLQANPLFLENPVLLGILDHLGRLALQDNPEATERQVLPVRKVHLVQMVLLATTVLPVSQVNLDPQELRAKRVFARNTVL